MKYSLLLIFVAFAIIISCNTSTTSGKLLSTDNLPLQEYTIDINRDTVLVTKNGALLKIPKGSLTTGNGNTVTLEIKEAYSLEQMINAGLVTQSNGEPLSSGGMIYINAKGGQDTKITQAIKVALPTDYLAEGMQLFKGQKDENGNINWKEPAALPENKQLSSIQQGQVLFQSKCANCHAIGKDMTGPDLAHFMKRFPYVEEGDDYRYYEHGIHYREFEGHQIKTKDSIYYYDHLEEYGTYNIYKCNLISRNGGSIGTAFFKTDTGTGYELLNIYKYIQNESDRRNLPLPAHAYLYDCADSCAKYKQAISDLNYQKEEARSRKKELIKENGSLVEEKKEPAPPVTITEPVGPPPPVDFEERVSPQYYDAEYYQFTIESFGWYNIDVLLKGINGVEESELFVRISGEYREKVKVFLIIPSVKVYVEGGPAERNKEEFAFDLKNGKISLPQNAKAYIMAVTEREESIAFALKEFTTSLKQEFDISLSSSTKEAFNAAISNIGFDNLDIKVSDAKNAAEIRKTNTELKDIDRELKNAENLKPKNCDCDCGSPKTSIISADVELNKADSMNTVDKK
ncbi:MAG TPA: c-type cytochrome [Chitinophagaceae bacterium]